MTTSFEAATRSLASTRQPTAEYSPSDAGSDFWGYNTSAWSSSAQAVTESSALSLPPFWGGVSLICECMGSIGVKVYRKSDRGGRVWADQHPVNWLLSKTNNGWMVPSVFKSMGQAALLLSGNFVGEIVRNGRGQAVQVNPWLPKNVHYGVDYDGSPMYGVNSFGSQTDDFPYIWDRERINGSRSQAEWFPYTECLHVKAWSSDGRVGRSILNIARQCLALGLTIEQFEQRYFDHSRPSGFLTKSSMLGKEERKILREEFKEIHEGARQAFNIGVLSGGLDWKAMGFNNNDAQMLQSKAFEVLQVCRLLHIPPHMLADLSKATETNIEQLMLEFLIYCIGPWMVKWKEEMNIKLFTPREQFVYEVDFDLETFLKADRKTQSEVNKTKIMSGEETISEVRIAAGKEVYPDNLGDEPLIMASQLDTLRNVREGKSPLQQGSPSKDATPKKV